MSVELAVEARCGVSESMSALQILLCACFRSGTLLEVIQECLHMRGCGCCSGSSGAGAFPPICHATRERHDCAKPLH